MDLNHLKRRGPDEWHISPRGEMRVPGVIYASEALVRDMDEKVYEQVTNVATLPGIVRASYAMPDAHWGYGFPIGGVAAFDPDVGGVVSAGGVGFDISCGVRALRTGLTVADLQPVKEELAEVLFHRIPAGVDSTGKLHLDRSEMDAMLADGARWAVAKGYGVPIDLDFIEENGCMEGAMLECLSDHAKTRQQDEDEMGTLGSGNHYLEVQQVVNVLATEAASAFDLHEGDIVVSIHCGSRGLGHQIGTEFLKTMAISAARHKIALRDRELTCAPINSEVGQEYLGAMRAGINCALANRQIITIWSGRRLPTCCHKPASRCSMTSRITRAKWRNRSLMGISHASSFIARARRGPLALGSRHPAIAPHGRSARPDRGDNGNSLIRACGHTREHVTGIRVLLPWGRSQHEPASSDRQWHGREVVRELAARGILIRSPSFRGVAEEAPGAYKDVSEVVDAADRANLARKVARFEPLICVKG